MTWRHAAILADLLA